MTQNLDSFPKIKQVVLSIAYDNGMINRESSQERFIEKVNEIIGGDGVYYTDLQNLNEWLETLSDDDLETFANGEHLDQVAIASQFVGPDILGLFTDIFEVDL